ncbi:MAG: lysophospholipid acyltransferase family protein [Gammaproteobacteria bacterium]|nr:lysophospholipid acyltransferase family protein [Gammaproteobacteria bacterium]
MAPRWLRRGRRRLAFELLRVVARLSQRLGGMALVRRSGEHLGNLHYRLSWLQRPDLQRQLDRLLPRTPAPSPAKAKAEPTLRQAYRNNDRAILEIIGMGCNRLPDDVIRTHCEISGMARLRDALSAGRGVILLGMHMGNGILMATRLAVDGLPVSVVARESRKTARGFLYDCLAGHGMEVITGESRIRAYKDMRRALRAGRVLYVLMDQATKHGGIPVEFLGKRIELPAGPPRLALGSQAPVLLALPLAAEPVWRFTIDGPLDMGPGDVEEAAAVMARAMESHILAYPQLWTWHHRRWRKYPFVSALAAD